MCQAQERPARSADFWNVNFLFTDIFGGVVELIGNIELERTAA